MKTDVLWQNFLNEVSEQVSPTTYNVWFNDLNLISIDVDKITIQVPMAVHKTMLGNTYYTLVENIFYSLTTRPVHTLPAAWAHYPAAASPHDSIL